LISIRKNLDELERLEELQRAAMDCYVQSIASTEQNAIEVDWAQAVQFRAHLQALKNQLQSATTSSQIQKVQSSFQGELRDYRDHAHEQIKRLRKDVEAAAAAVETFAGTFAASGADHEVDLKRELKRLDNAAQADDLAQLRSSVQAAVGGIASSFERMRTSNQLAIGQLKDEIRLLHQQIEAERRSRTPNASSESWDLKKIGGGVDQLLSQRVPFYLVVVVVRNLTGLENIHSRSVIELGLNSLQGRLRSLVSGAVMTGRWRKDQFVALVRGGPAGAKDMSRDVGQQLSKAYLLLENGVSHKLMFNVLAGVVYHDGSSDPVKLYPRLEQMLETLARA